MEILKTPFLFLLFVVVANGDVIGAQVFHYSYLHVHLFTPSPKGDQHQLSPNIAST